MARKDQLEKQAAAIEDTYAGDRKLPEGNLVATSSYCGLFKAQIPGVLPSSIDGESLHSVRKLHEWHALYYSWDSSVFSMIIPVWSAAWEFKYCQGKSFE